MIVLLIFDLSGTVDTRRALIRDSEKEKKKRFRIKKRAYIMYNNCRRIAVDVAV